jgi:ketosteroid isomerase-like protein
MRAVAELWNTNLESTVVAIRGERLVLMRNRLSVRDEEPEAFSTEVLAIGEIDADERGVAVVTFDVDDIDAALAELDARYLAGEAAAHADTWSVIAGAHAAFNRHELPATTPDPVYIDHRPLVSIEGADLAATLRAVWELTPQFSIYIEAVHRLDELGAVYTQVLKGTSPEGLDAEWRMIDVFTVEGDLFSRVEVFEEADLDAALARFEELHPQPPRLENAASRLHERFLEYYAAGDSQAMAEMLADTYCSDDRRRVVGSGVRHGRDAHIADMRARAELWNTNLESTVMAIRGERLALMRIGLSDRDEEPEAFSTEVLAIGEIDADERIVASVTFDLDEIDAAFAELDARYLAGEASVYAQTWSAVAGVFAAFNRRELPAPDYVAIDHRRATLFTSSELAASIRDSFNLTPDLSIHIEAVHRLAHFGALLTNTSYGSSQEGFDAEWRMIQLLTVEGDRVTRLELFDEIDLDAALARFEELQPPPPWLENAAGRIVQRYLAHFAARDWAAFAELLADDIVADDRRRVVNAGIRRGRDVHIADNRVVVEVSAPTVSSSIIATRGERLALANVRIFNRGMSGEVGAEVLGIAEIDSDERIVAIVTFDPDDIDAAFAELEARYLAGEASDYAHTWSVIARTTDAFNRRELTAADYVTIDHRPLAIIDATDPQAALRVWDVTPDFSIHIEAVHRLGGFGAVATYTARGTSQEGFDAEWRMIQLLTVEGDRINRCEVFDEADLDAALARFDELHPQPPRLENAASQLIERFRTYFAARNWAAVAENSAHEIFTDDRRSVVSSGILHGRDNDVANIRAIADLGATDLTSTVIATRGERLVLTRLRLSGRDQRPEAFHSEMLGIVEIDADNRVAARFLFDLDEIDAAFEELDARYLAGEAAAYARTWSVNSGFYAGFNRHQLPATTPDWIYIDHRPLVTIEANDLSASMRAIWDLAPDISIYMEAVHRLSDIGAVVTAAVYGNSQEGFNAEWRMIDLFTVEGDLISRCEIFDEADLDAALARFDELEQRTASFGNAATRIWARAADAFNGRDVDSFLGLMTADGQFEDRRKGLRAVHTGSARQQAVRAVFEEAPASWRMHAEPIAIRGSRLELTRESYCDIDDVDRPIAVEFLHVMELGDDDLMRDIVSFDSDDLDDAFAELTVRWIASGEVAYPELIEAVDRINATINRHEWGAVATYFDGVDYVDHRQLARAVNGTIADWLSWLQTTGSLVPDLRVEFAEILARCAIGIVGRMALKGTSTDGAAIETPFVVLMLLRGERVTRLEAFDEDQRELALTRLQEFNRPV